MLIIAKILILFNKNFSNDFNSLKKIIATCGKKSPERPHIFALIAAEDHRFKLHFGIDFISIIRAIYITNVKNTFQGGSTIEQQLVRVITFRYERTLRRKFREQLLAILISHYFNKSEIASSYLNTAYFGYGINGIKKALNRITETEKLNYPEFIAASLKYPRPEKECHIWNKKIERRISYIINRKIKYYDWIHR